MNFPSQRWKPDPVIDIKVGYDPTGLLDSVDHFRIPGGGPDDIVLDDVAFYTGLHDGRIVRVPLDGGPVATLGNTGGRPLGVEWLPDGDLLVGDAHRGLLRVYREGGPIREVVTSVNGRKLLWTNKAAVEPDGTIWFTESSRVNELEDFVDDVVEHNGSGRLLRRDPDGSVEEVLTGLSLANGVTLVGDDEVWVAETAAYTIHRVKRSGPDAGSSSTVTSGLPGFPNALSTGADGTIWVSLNNPRNPVADTVRAMPKIARELVKRVPEGVTQRLVVPYARILGFAPDGTIRHDLQGKGEACRFITTAVERSGQLYLGSLDEDITWVSRVPVPIPGRV